jgi:hypothetical protein
MVKLLDDGSVVIPGEKVAHASLHALVTFHRREPFGRWDELLTHPCGLVTLGPPRVTVGARGPRADRGERAAPSRRRPGAWPRPGTPQWAGLFPSEA